MIQTTRFQQGWTADGPIPAVDITNHAAYTRHRLFVHSGGNFSNCSIRAAPSADVEAVWNLSAHIGLESANFVMNADETRMFELTGIFPLLSFFMEAQDVFDEQNPGATLATLALVSWHEVID